MEAYISAIENIQAQYLQTVKDNNFGHLSFEVEANIALRMVANSSGNIPLKKASPTSVAHALFNAGAMGISIAPTVDHAMLVADVSQAGEIIAKLHLTYKGLLHLCYEAGSISHITSWVIRKNDKVRMSNELTSKPELEISDLFGDRGDVTGALCTICTPNGDYLTTLMNKKELDQIAEQSGNDAWHGVFADEFRKKQVLKRALHTMASTHNSRLAKAAQFLTDSDLDLYERTDMTSIDRSKYTDNKPKTEKFTRKTKGRNTKQPAPRGEKYFKRQHNTVTTNIPPAQPVTQTKGLFF